MLRKTIISALAPEISVSCQILVLESMPGAILQKEAEYYAHPQNLFGIVLRPRFRLTETCCIMRGWRRLVIPSFANEIDNELLADVEIIGLPSTSPAHAALSPAAKIDTWCAALGKR